VFRRERRVGLDTDPVGLDTDPVGLDTVPVGLDTGLEGDFRVERHTVVDNFVEVDRIEAEIVRIVVVGRRLVGRHRREFALDTRLERVVGFHLGRVFRLAVVVRREDSPAVLDCSNFRQTFYFLEVEEGMFWFEEMSEEGALGQFISDACSAIRYHTYHMQGDSDLFLSGGGGAVSEALGGRLCIYNPPYVPHR